MGSERIEYGHNSAGEQYGSVMNPGSCNDVQIVEQEFNSRRNERFFCQLYPGSRQIHNDVGSHITYILSFHSSLSKRRQAVIDSAGGHTES